MRRARLLCSLLVATLLLSGIAQAQPRKLLIVVMDRVAWQDLRVHESAAPTFWHLAQSSAVGAMCVRAVGSSEGNGAYLTLGAGSRAASGTAPDKTTDLEGHAFNVDELVGTTPASVAYQATTGWSPRRDRIVHLGVGAAAWQNDTASYPLELGLLGEALRKARLRVACFGNADSTRGPHREAVAIVMDHAGRVARGDVGADLLVRDDLLAAGYRTDGDKLVAAFAREAATTDVAVVDLGETSRVEEFLETMPPEAMYDALEGGLARADQVLGKLLAVAPPEQWAVLLLGPAVPSPSPERQYAALAPVVLRRPDGGPGLLTSPSTRRPGLVVSTDVAATVLDYFGIRPSANTVGRPMQVQATSLALGRLEHDLARTDALEASRRGLFRGFATYATVILWLIVLCFLLGEGVPAWLRVLLRGLLLVALALPSGTLLVALWPDPLSPGQTTSIVVGLSLALALGASIATRWRHADALLAAVLTGLLVLDLLTGEHMLWWSTFSYSTAAGARFYGVGNEYAGAMFGASLLAAAIYLSRARRLGVRLRVLVSLALVVVTALIGWPRLGANFGMALSCAIGFGVFAIYLWRGRFRWMDLAAIGVAVIAVAALVVVVDALAARHSGSSHIGLLLTTMREEGPAALFDAISRKLNMSWMLLRVSIWTGMALGAAAFLLMVLLLRPAPVLEALRRQGWLLPGLIALVVGCFASLLLNDSGILAAAIALLYGAGSLGYLALGRTTSTRERRAVVVGKGPARRE